MAKNPTPTKTMTPSWELFRPNLLLIREHYVSVMYLFLLPSLVAALGSVMLGSPSVDNGSLTLTSGQKTGLLLMFVSFLWQVINLGPLTYFQLRAAAGKADSLGAYYRQGLGYDLRLVLYYLAFGVLTVVGLLLFIVPGLIVIRRYFLGNYYLVDKKLTVGEALRQSAAGSKPYAGAIWGIIGVQLSMMLLAVFVQSLLSYAGLIASELIACSYIFLAVLRYREIERR